MRLRLPLRFCDSCTKHVFSGSHNSLLVGSVIPHNVFDPLHAIEGGSLKRRESFACWTLRGANRFLAFLGLSRVSVVCCVARTDSSRVRVRPRPSLLRSASFASDSKCRSGLRPPPAPKFSESVVIEKSLSKLRIKPSLGQSLATPCNQMREQREN